MATSRDRPRRRGHHELHPRPRHGWLRATVLGANDGILSTGALLLGVIGSGASRDAVLTAGLAGLAAGAASMAIGEYVSVSSQRDAERSLREVEAAELRRDPEGELRELTEIYRDRGVSAELAPKVAEQLMAADPLETHLRDELGLTEQLRARPLLASGSSFVSFVLGAALPLAAAALSSSARALAVTVTTLLALAVLGGTGAALGGAPIPRGSLRVGVGGAAALGLTYGVGALIGTAVG